MTQERMSGATERDPRVDPQPGDVLRMSYGDEYRVLAVDSVSITDTPNKQGHVDYGEKLWNLRGTWRKWAASAEVVHRAGDAAVEG